MSLQKECCKFYIGCPTNFGELVGLCEDRLYIKFETSEINVFKSETLGNSLFLFLRRMNELNQAEISSLIEKGVNIGRPKGHSFSIDAFVLLINLKVDIFGLINAGFAKALLQQR